MTAIVQSTAKFFQSIEEDRPGAKWLAHFNRCWPAQRDWFFSQGDAARPSYAQCLKKLRQCMPELESTYQCLTDLAGGGDSVSRYLSMYCPPAYLSGCTQVVWTDDEPVLVRNYDYHPDCLEGIVVKTRWNGQTVIAMSDTLWGVLDGINESGLSVSLAFGGRAVLGPGFGVPIILRYILEFCEDTHAAIKVLKTVPTHMSYNITMVDRKHVFATVFIAPDRSPVVHKKRIATNHQGKIEWPAHALASATLEREREAQSILDNAEETVQGLISSFLRPPIFNSDYDKGFGTLYTAVYQPCSASVDYLWTDHVWRYSVDRFKEEQRQVVFPIL